VTDIVSVHEAVVPGRIYRIPIHNESVQIGVPSAESGRIALTILQQVAANLLSGDLQGVVTGPVSKEAIRYSDPAFIGHTEFFAQRAGVEHPLMTFHGPVFNLCLLTTHLPLSELDDALDDDSVRSKLELLWQEAGKTSSSPRIALLALDPHAGETGGTTDARFRIILDSLKDDGISIDGPYPADSFFLRHAGEYQWVVAPYHDEGLIPFKMLSGGHSVNVTLGLPFLRASVDHGTAFEIAGQGIADETSMSAALDYAEKHLHPERKTFRPPYSHFAKYYDRYMQHVGYETWIEFIMARFRELTGHTPRHTLEIACGTAGIATRLVDMGLTVDASDGCPEMLREAFRKSSRPNLFRADLLAPVKQEAYDLILLIFDSLNYLPELAMVDTLLANVKAGLKLGGVFIFDISTLNNSTENFDGLMNIEEYPDCTMIHTSDLHRKQMTQVTRLTFFIRQGYHLRKEEETHRQHVYRVGEVIEAIPRAGLELVGIWAPEEPAALNATVPNRLDKKYPRLFFVVHKP
jgi:4-hydroxythreonine-4-phosphate dehydrogenase